MVLQFHKYQGTGNDFVMINDMNSQLPELSQNLIEKICHRRFGVGADGLIILRPSGKHDFKMVYYNSDGRESSMCGNGGRCIVKFASDQGIRREEYLFEAIDGLHRARIDDRQVQLQMIDVTSVSVLDPQEMFLDTGSPHHVRFTRELPGDSFVSEARKIRYGNNYQDQGVNVNFVEVRESHLVMRTYERGVEDETLSCGTGVTAAALAAAHFHLINGNLVEVDTSGGILKVSFEREGEGFTNVWLEGPAEHVFDGRLEI